MNPRLVGSRSLDGGPHRPRLGAPSFKRVRPPAPPSGHFRTYKVSCGVGAAREGVSHLCKITLTLAFYPFKSGLLAPEQMGQSQHHPRRPHSYPLPRPAPADFSPIWESWLLGFCPQKQPAGQPALGARHLGACWSGQDIAPARAGKHLREPWREAAAGSVESV